MFIYIQLIQQALVLKIQLVLTHIYCVIKGVTSNELEVNKQLLVLHSQFFSMPTLILQLEKQQNVIYTFISFNLTICTYYTVVHGGHACTVLNDLWLMSCHDQSYQSYGTVACLCLSVQWLEFIKDSGLHYNIYLIFYIHSHIAT